MPRRGQSAWNKKFGSVAKACFTETVKEGKGGMQSYGKCMSRELKKVSPKKKSKGKKRR